ncbi:MAG TPA: class III lanthipeptide [Actinomycetota bacterium]|nr:class III lanthipeptide [Actinomycetota bacterium]
MAILDLQAIELEEPSGPDENGGSHGSKGCGPHGSFLSLLLC